MRPLWDQPDGMIVLTVKKGWWQKLRFKAWWHHAFLLPRTVEQRRGAVQTVSVPFLRWESGKSMHHKENQDLWQGNLYCKGQRSYVLIQCTKLAKKFRQHNVKHVHCHVHLEEDAGNGPAEGMCGWLATRCR